MKIVLQFLLFTVCACQSQTKKLESVDEPNNSHETKPYVLQKNEGEVLNDPRGRTMIIKVSPETGAAHLSMGTTEIPEGTNIVVHRHEHSEEILFVHRGNGTAFVNSDSINISEGSTLFIPSGA